MKNLYHIIITFSILILMIIGCKNQNNTTSAPASKSSTPASTPEYLTTVESEHLAWSYNNNEVRADDLYDNDTFLIVGEIKEIGKTFTGKPYIILNGDEKDSPMPTYIDIQIVFNRSEKDKIAKLSKSDKIKAKATCKGLSIGNVVLDDGELR